MVKAHAKIGRQESNKIHNSNKTAKSRPRGRPKKMWNDVIEQSFKNKKLLWQEAKVLEKTENSGVYQCKLKKKNILAFTGL